jgi:hypothetical protein
MITDVTIHYTMTHLIGILQYLGEMPPPWNPIYDLNGDAVINLKDLLLCLAGL